MEDRVDELHGKKNILVREDGYSEQDSESKIESSTFVGNSNLEGNKEIEYDLQVAMRSDSSLGNEEKAVKKPGIDFEKDSKMSSPQDKYNSKDIEKRSVGIQGDIPQINKE